MTDKIVDLSRRRQRRAMAARIDVSHRVMEFAASLLSEGFESDDIVDALFRAAARRIGNKAEYLDWATDMGSLEFDEPDIPVPNIEDY